VSKYGDTMSGDLDMGGNYIRNLHNPVNSSDAATRNYVDNSIQDFVEITGDTMSGDLDMGGNFIHNLHAPMSNADGATKLYVDAISTLSVAKAGDTMSGNLLLSGGDDTYRNLGCTELNEGKTFQVLMGDNNFFGYTKPPVGITNPVILDCSGFLIKFNGNNIMRVATSGSDLEIITYKRFKINAEINCNGYNIYSLADPLGDSDAATKRYVDKKKNLVGYVPHLGSNNSKTGFIVSQSSLFSISYYGFNVFNNADNLLWATAGVTSNFWIKVLCPNSVIVWKFHIRGKLSNAERIYNWRFEGSNDDATWATLYEGVNDYLGSTMKIYDISSSNSTSYIYYRIYVTNGEGRNPGLSHWQLFVY
jgi:hypothetical protein